MVPGPGIGEVPGNPGKIKTEVLSEKGCGTRSREGLWYQVGEVPGNPGKIKTEVLSEKGCGTRSRAW